MITTVEQLIESLKREYAPDEVIAYTIYSKDDVLVNPERHFDDSQVAEAWNESIVHDVDSAIDTAQGDINACLDQAIYRY
jgi:hypothetical protein